ncbi:MAG TPA: 30S ribosomal protein S1 [Candidatus Krumholzibacteria bacterium]|nr:30S ribosomal protein S1 [Candidatus Krumholzibacteria bacterium]HRX52047.1 30S ribosomal protein S1 [Candidatus Krumholzibacteria bacterium]
MNPNPNAGDDAAVSNSAAFESESKAPKLTSEFDPNSIVNLDYLEDGDDLSTMDMLALLNQYEETLNEIQEGQILKGVIVEVRENEVLLNIGFKSEGVIPIEEFGATDLKEGDEFDVFLEHLEDQDGLVVLSKERADFLKVWDKIKLAHESGDVVTGTVDRRIKGGLVVKLWDVDTFLPGSQVALRQVPDLDQMIGKEIECQIIKKNKRRRNVVVSRRIVLERERESKKKNLMSELDKGQTRKGVVKNITDFGAFVDLGGIDGLLHITDLSWGRVKHPSEVVSIGEEIDVKILDFDRERERISLGLKQLQSYPWENVESKYPEKSIVQGKVVSITNYGAFVELEQGIEGLIHISEMSWTRHIKHPSKILSIGDVVEVMVLKIDKENEKISLGLKQTEQDPWLTLHERYPVGTIIEGRVRNLTDFGAFVEVEEGIDGLVHISDMSWTKRVRHPKEIVRKGDLVQVQILDIDTDKRRISLGIKQLQDNPWPTLAEDYPVGRQVEGKVIRMLDHGLVVEMSGNLEGFVPVGHLAIPKIDKPQFYFHEDEALPLHVIKMDAENRRIVLSVAEYYKDQPRELLEAYIAEHPRRDDVVEAEADPDGDDYSDMDDDVPAADLGFDDDDAPADEEPSES